MIIERRALRQVCIGAPPNPMKLDRKTCRRWFGTVERLQGERALLPESARGLGEAEHVLEDSTTVLGVCNCRFPPLYPAYSEQCAHALPESVHGWVF